MSETETATNVLPCPFCGEDPEIEQIGNAHTKTRKTQIRCRHCAIAMRVGSIANSVSWTRRQVISQWNKRTGTAMSAKRMNWAAVSEALQIETDTCAVYRTPPARYRDSKRRVTKDAAISDAIKQLTRDLIPCDCQDAEPDTMDGRGDPGNYCHCVEKREIVSDTLLDVVKRLPEAAEEWAKVTSDEHWELYDWPSEVYQ